MGQTAEVLARAVRHHARGVGRTTRSRASSRAEAAIAAGRFADEITPAPGLDAKGKAVELTTDEHPRAGTTIEALRKLPLGLRAGRRAGGHHHGRDVVGHHRRRRRGRARERGRSGSPRPARRSARIVGWATAGVDPRIMGIGPVPAVRKLLARTGLALDDFDLVELNEAFAPQVLAVLSDLPIDRERLNVNGGAIALGHPIGATGTRILVTLLYEMARRGARRGLATLCVSGGLGMAIAVERGMIIGCACCSYPRRRHRQGRHR